MMEKAKAIGAFKTSMLQDAEAGRGPLEIDALLGLVRLHAQTRGLY